MTDVQLWQAKAIQDLEMIGAHYLARILAEQLKKSLVPEDK